jgi:hypothetical protein
MKLTKIEFALGKEKIGSYVMHHPQIGFALDSQDAAMILEVLIGWDGAQHDPDGWIYKNHRDLRKETGLSKRQQRPAIKLLLDLGLVKKRTTGVPPTNGFLLQKVRIQEWWDEYCKRNNLSPLTAPETSNQPAPEEPNILYTSTTLHEATAIPTPALDLPVPKTDEFKYIGTFKMKKAMDGYFAKSAAEKVRLAEAAKPTIEETNQAYDEVERVIIAVQKYMKLPMLDRTLGENRRLAKLALDKFGMDTITIILEIASEDEFWRSRVTSVADLYYHGIKILSSKRYSDSKGACIV